MQLRDGFYFCRAVDATQLQINVIEVDAVQSINYNKEALAFKIARDVLGKLTNIHQSVSQARMFNNCCITLFYIL
jgi:hypothetical protein